MTKKWYQDWRSWLTILFLFFVPTFIIGLILMWTIAPWSKKSKWWITGIGLGIPLFGILVSIILISVNPTKQISKAKDATKITDVQEISTQARRFCLEIGRCPISITEIRDRGYIKNVPIDSTTGTYYFYEVSKDGKDCTVKTTLGTGQEFMRPCTSSYLP